MNDLDLNGHRARMFQAIADFFVALTDLTKTAKSTLVDELTTKQARHRPTTRYPEGGRG